MFLERILAVHLKEKTSDLRVTKPWVPEARRAITTKLDSIIDTSGKGQTEVKK